MSCCTGTLPPAETFMARAVELAEQGRGAVAPNPCVGAVLVRDGRIVAEGRHRRYGGPHAEVECLAEAKAKGVDPAACTLYVTLEPCNHQGQTPPCTQAILAAGVRELVVGCADPNPDVAGGGADFLRREGLTVTVGVLEERCRDLIADFLVWKTTNRPYSILKMASTLDGRIAARGGRPEPISGPASQEAAHRIRARVQAVVVGGNTFYSDDPRLTCRLPDLPADHPQPWAVVVTRRLPRAHNFALLQQRPERVVFWTGEAQARSGAAEALAARGCRVWGLPPRAHGLDLAPGYIRLRSELGCLSVLSEGGGHLAWSMVSQGLMDEFVLFLSPLLAADDQAKALFAGAETTQMAQALRLRLAACVSSGADLQLTYRPLREG